MDAPIPPFRKAPKAPEAQCISCKEALIPGSRYCKSCQTYQNWRRHLQISSTFLSLLVALVSVIGSSLPAIQKALTVEKSDITVRLADIDLTNITDYVDSVRFKKPIIYRGFIETGHTTDVPVSVILINSGNKPGAVTLNHLFISSTTDQTPLIVVGKPNNIDYNKQESVISIEPGTFKNIRIHFAIRKQNSITRYFIEKLKNLEFTDIYKSDVSLSYTILNFNSKSEAGIARFENKNILTIK